MRIALCLTDMPPEPWLRGLREALPEAQVAPWSPDAPGAWPAEHAVVWAPPQPFIDAQPRLQTLFNVGAGVDALMKLQLPAHVRIVRLDDAGMAVQMAEYVCHALTGFYREFAAYAEQAREGEWTPRKPQPRSDFAVGILGLGVLGQRVAQAVRHFDFPVRGWSRTPHVLDGVQTFAGDAQLGDFLAGTRVLVNLLPLTPATEGILNQRTLRQLQPGGHLINIARGAHLVEEDLIPLLDSGWLHSATLDVFRTEPLPPEHPFWRHPRISVTPHSSARTLRRESIAQIAGKLRALQRGEPIAGVVERGRGY